MYKGIAYLADILLPQVAVLAVNTEDAKPTPDRPAAKAWICCGLPQLIASMDAHRAASCTE
jgi:hypothetical protein